MAISETKGQGWRAIPTQFDAVQFSSKLAGCHLADCRKIKAQAAVNYLISIAFKENHTALQGWRLGTTMVVYSTENRTVCVTPT